VRVKLPFEQDVNPFVGQVYEHKTFFSRLHHFMIASDAFVVVPGGSERCWSWPWCGSS
jgi:predicted Rossmann-fold nucleotide-binding protein